MVNRRLLVGLILLIALPLGLAGCKTGAGGARPAHAYVVPEWNDLGIETLAFLGVGSSVGEETVRQTAELLLEEKLLSAQDRFVILSLTEARSRGDGDEADKLVRAWRDARTVDVLLVQRYCRAAAVDGILLGDLSEWKQERVDWTSEGSSSTQVNLRLSIYSGKTGLLAWDATKMARKESMTYQPSASGTAGYTGATGAPRSERAGAMTPDPPPADEVALEAIASLMAAFPEPPAAR